MNSRSKRVLRAGLLSAGVVLSACGGNGPADPSPPPPPVQDTVFGDAVGTMDRARAVEDITMQHKQAVDQAIEHANGDGPAAGSP